MSKNRFHFKQFSLTIVRSLRDKTVLFQVIQFNISTHFSSVRLIDGILSGAITPGQTTPESKCNEGVLCIHQSSSITKPSTLDCLVSYPGHLLKESFPSAEVQSEYTTAPADWA